MRNGTWRLCVIVLLLSACSNGSEGSSEASDDDEGSAVSNANSGDDDDDDDDGDDDDGDQTGATPRDTGTERKPDAASIKGSKDAASDNPKGESKPDAGASAPDGGGTQGTPKDEPEPGFAGPPPVIPKASMACPAFKSGMNNIMGLSVEILMGPAVQKKGPLLFNWHGTGGTGPQAMSMLPAKVKSEIMAAGGMIVAPTDTTKKGTDVTFVLSVWYSPGDFEFADLVVACAVEQLNIDPRRIYSTGCSAGGLMSGVMAYHRSSYLAASAPNSGGIAPVPGLAKLQDPKHVPAVMTMHGARGQGKDMVIIEFADSSKDLDTGLSAAGGFVMNCDHGGGHCGASAELQTAAWQFMKDHPYGVSPEPYANGLPASFPNYCKIFK